MKLDETKEKIQELVTKIRENKNDVKQVLPFWRQIKELDVYSNYVYLYADLYRSLISQIDVTSMELVDVWEVSNHYLKLQNSSYLNKVLDLVQDNPEKCLEIWNSAAQRSKILKRPKVVENILRMDFENNYEEKFKIFQGIFSIGDNLAQTIDFNYICEALKLFSKRDSYLALDLYNHISDDKKEQARKFLDMPKLIKTLSKDIEKEEDIMGLISFYNVINEIKDLEINIEEYKNVIKRKLKNNPKVLMEGLREHGYECASLLNPTVIEAIANLEDNGEDISRYRYFYELSRKEIDELIESRGEKGLPKEIDITLNLKDISEFSDQILGKVKSAIKKIVFDETYQEYSYEDIAVTKGVIDELLKDVNLGDENDPKRQRKIFEQVIRKLGKHIKYNYKAYNKEQKENRLIKKIHKPWTTEKQKEKLITKIETLDADVGSLHIRDVVGGLIYGKAVCVGYAEIVKNVFACVGIEAKSIGGLPEKHGFGHQWNQIKIDGKWYNLDLTWDRDLLLLGCPARWLLKSDKEFKSHEKYFLDEYVKKEKCETSVKREDINKYVIHGFKTVSGIFKKPNKVKTWLKNSLRSLKIKDIENAIGNLAKDVSQYKEKNHEQDEI